MTDRGRGSLMIMAASVCWATEGLLIRLVHSDDWQTLFWTSLAMSVSIGGWLAVTHGRNMIGAVRATGWPGAIASTALALAYACFIFSLNRTAVANTVVLLATIPLIAAILARVVLGERISRRTLIACIGAFAGVALMVSDSLGGGRLSGDLFALATAVFYSINVVALRAAPKINDSYVDMVPTTVVGGLAVGLVAAGLSNPVSVAMPDMALLLIIGAGSMGFGTWLFTRGVRYVQAAEAGLLCLLEAIVAPFLVWIFLDEMPSPMTFYGGAIVLAALVYDTLPQRSAPGIAD